MEYYSAMKRSEILTHATTRMNFGSMLSERSQTPNACTVCFIRYVAAITGKPTEAESRLEAARGGVVRTGRDNAMDTRCSVM